MSLSAVDQTIPKRASAETAGSAQPAQAQQLSWRDPAGFVVRHGERILRAVRPADASELRALLESDWYGRLAAAGKFPRSSWLETPPAEVAGADAWTWLEHEPIAYPCYPHEITALQLYDAAMLTLEIAREGLKNGWVLKDASSWNVLFDDARPVFCDVLSFQRYANDRMWPAYAQFCRHFVIPLLLHRQLGVLPANLLLLRRDGVTPEEARPMLKGLAAYRQPALETVTLPAALAGKSAAPRKPGDAGAQKQSGEVGIHVMDGMLARLQRHIERLRPRRGKATVWEHYTDTRVHYSDSGVQQKHAFVKQALSAISGERVLDLGCNAGEFSRIAASVGKKVVAADFDHGALTRLYEELREAPAGISPMLLDIGRPTPAVGWMNREVPSFIERSRGRFDCVMALGLIHHLIVSERAPLQMILDLMLALGPKAVIIEWVEPRDPRFQQIAGINKALYEDLDSARFENVFSRAFRLVAKSGLLEGTRTVYHWERI